LGLHRRLEGCLTSLNPLIPSFEWITMMLKAGFPDAAVVQGVLRAGEIAETPAAIARVTEHLVSTAGLYLMRERQAGRPSPRLVSRRLGRLRIAVGAILGRRRGGVAKRSAGFGLLDPTSNDPLDRAAREALCRSALRAPYGDAPNTERFG
jgi:hypothetical protein